MDVFWAAFGGGAAAGVVTLVAVVVGEYIRWRLIQPKLEVSVSLGDLGRAEAGEIVIVPRNDNPKKVFFSARNPRTHPVTVVSFGFVVRRGEKRHKQVGHQAGFGFPYEVAGGKSLTQWMETKVLLESLEKSGNSPSDIKYAWFSSASGRDFRGKLDKSTVNALNRLARIQAR